MKKWLLIGAVVLVIVIGGGVFFLISSLDSLVVAGVEKFGSEITRTQVRLKEAKISITSGEGVDVIIDATGDAQFLNSCLPALKPDGKAAPYATYKTGDTIAKTIDPAKIVQGATGEDRAHQYLLDAVRLGLVDLTNYYSHRLPFERIEEGFELLKNKTAFKIVFEMEDGR